VTSSSVYSCHIDPTLYLPPNLQNAKPKEAVSFMPTIALLSTLVTY
jgi:hypothetical protein